MLRGGQHVVKTASFLGPVAAPDRGRVDRGECDLHAPGAACASRMHEQEHYFRECDILYLPLPLKEIEYVPLASSTYVCRTFVVVVQVDCSAVQCRIDFDVLCLLSLSCLNHP
jgi:hypothetical protein